MDDFSPRYCPEYFVTQTDKTGPPPFAIAMTCFCDLPLFLIKKHLQRYGPFGLGLRKEWALKNGITPVLYVHSHSVLLEVLNKTVQKLAGMKTDDESQNLLGYSQTIIKYIKPHTGPAWRKGEREEGIRFYDEREWRYAPNSRTTQKYAALSTKEYLDPATLEAANKEMADNYRLPIAFDDIQYLIVKGERDVPQMMEIIKGVIEKKYPNDLLMHQMSQIWMTKIMMAERINEDF